MSTWWPSLAEYTVAVLNPKLAFVDKDLCDAVVTKTAEETPRVAMGMNARVYELQRGEKSWAVRCFQHQVSDQQRRYDLLFKHLLGRQTNDFLVNFEYLEKGIRHNQLWYPIVKMDWVQGCSLQTAVREMIDYPGDLLELAKELRSLVLTLRDLDIAHGDLEPGNILVTQYNKLKLIDYDGVFVPPMKGEKAPESGHSNFVHPRRNERCFDENLDNFPAIVIFLSLRALASDRSLWDRYSTGDNLLFVESDYKNPLESSLLKELKKSKDPVVSRLAIKVADFCLKESREIPCLEDFLNDSKDGLFPAELLKKRKASLTSEIPKYRADDLSLKMNAKEELLINSDPRAIERKSVPSEKEPRRDPKISQSPIPVTSTAPIMSRLKMTPFLIFILIIGFLSAMIAGRLLKKAEEKSIKAVPQASPENQKQKYPEPTNERNPTEPVRIQNGNDEPRPESGVGVLPKPPREAVPEASPAPKTQNQQQKDPEPTNERKTTEPVRIQNGNDEPRPESGVGVPPKPPKEAVSEASPAAEPQKKQQKEPELTSEEKRLLKDAQEMADNEAIRRRAEEQGFYIVGVGESLDSVAKKLAFLVTDLQKKNDLKENVLVAGQKLQIPEYRTYIARQGETIDAVALRFGLTKEKVGLKVFNSLEKDVLGEGKELLLPVKSKR